ncbi:MAG: M48 family peptidase, partial [Candidatus Omnitrophica bacterium]|nr:M48 family peptidase [Candidatus Omnitrophota bacterium]
MNIYLVIILAILIGEYLLGLVVEGLNLRAALPVLPREFKGFYDSKVYSKSQDYLRENTKFKLVKSTCLLLIILTFILTGGFNFVDRLSRGFNLTPIPTGIIFAGILTLALQILNIPFAAYRTFVIEERYGFNRTTWVTFV